MVQFGTTRLLIDGPNTIDKHDCDEQANNDCKGDSLTLPLLHFFLVLLVRLLFFLSFLGAVGGCVEG